MAKRTFLAGATSQTIDVFVEDSSKTDGSGLSGLAYNTSGLTAYYRKGALGTATAITLATLATVGTAWSSGGFIEIDATHMKGWYRLDVPDTVFASTPFATVHLYGAANMVQCVVELEIVAYNPFDGVRAGLTALPNAAAEASGGLYTRGSGAGQIAQQANGQIDANLSTIKTQTVTCAAGVTVLASVGTAATSTAQTGDGYGILNDVTNGNAAIKTAASAIKTVTDKFAFTVANQVDANALKIGGTTQTGRDLGTSVLLSSGTGTGQIDFTSGVVKANLVQILATALTETAGQIAAAFKKFFNVTGPTGTANDLPGVAPGSNGGLPTVDASNRLAGIQGTKHTLDDLNDLSQANVRTAAGLASANLDTQLASLQSDTDDIQTRLPAALTANGNMKADTLRVGGTVQTAGDIAALINALALYTTHVVARCTVTGSPTTTSIPTSACSPAGAGADQFKGRIIVFDNDTTTAALRGQATDITASSNSATPTFTVTALTTAPSSSDSFTII